MKLRGGEREEAKRVFEKAAEEAPEDEEIQRWIAQAAASPSTSRLDEDVPLDAESVFQALFGKSTSSLDVTRVFEERYEGKSVEWSGKLRQVDRFTYDYVFGNEPGTKAIVEVLELDTDVYGEREVLAVVELPAEAADQLAGQAGHAIAFTGRLLKVDGLMRSIYVASGDLHAQ